MVATINNTRWIIFARRDKFSFMMKIYDSRHRHRVSEEKNHLPMFSQCIYTYTILQSLSCISLIILTLDDLFLVCRNNFWSKNTSALIVSVGVLFGQLISRFYNAKWARGRESTTFCQNATGHRK